MNHPLAGCGSIPCFSPDQLAVSPVEPALSTKERVRPQWSLPHYNYQAEQALETGNFFQLLDSRVRCRGQIVLIPMWQFEIHVSINFK